MEGYHSEVTSPGMVVLIVFAAKVKPARFQNAVASALHALPFGFNPGDATGAQEIEV